MNRLPEFFDLLREAFTASEDVDNYDINSNNDGNVIKFGNLIQCQNIACVALINFIKLHGDEVKQQLA
jgi:hypothetical protein